MICAPTSNEGRIYETGGRQRDSRIARQPDRFLVRPLGGWLFGRYADRFGRRAALTLSVTLIGVRSLGIAVLPGYAQISAMAPALPVAVRLLQGMSLGGEFFGEGG